MLLSFSIEISKYLPIDFIGVLTGDFFITNYCLHDIPPMQFLLKKSNAH